MPSDAIWTGVIIGAVGVAGMATTGLTALRLDRRRVRIEHERLRRQDEREQHRERGAAYYRTVILVHRLDRFAAGHPPDEDTLTASIEDYNKSVSALQLVGVRSVLDAIRDVQALMREVGAAMAGRSARGDPVVDGFVEAWNDLRAEIMDAERRLVAAMRQDIGPHHAGASEPD